MRSGWLMAAGFAAVVLAASEARATDTTIGPGQTYTLTADLLLAPGDNFTAGDPAGARCTIHGAGFGIASADNWTGSFSLRNCDVDGLGTAEVEAIYLKGTAGAPSIVIEGTQFSAGGFVRVNIDGGATAISFRNNTLTDDNLYPAVVEFVDSAPAFWVTGDSTGSHVFQGNRVYRSRVKFTSTSNWLVEGNVMIGIRAGIELENANTVNVRNNYSHTLVGGPSWNQVKNIAMAEGNGNIIEHNVFWGRQWLAELAGGGEFRYNLGIDSVERGWVLTYYNMPLLVHHNLLIQTKENQNQQAPGIVITSDTSGDIPRLEVFNNTFDAGNKCNPAIPAAVEFVGGDSLAKSLRSNAFLNVRVVPEAGAALVRLDDLDYPTDQKLPDFMPVHLQYADYNLFFNPDSPVKVSYGVAVDGKVARQDPGFGANDAVAGGPADQQVDPGYVFSKIPRVLPYKEDDIKSGASTVCQILAYYRRAYTPPTSSPLLGHGDPADGAGNDIGAIGDGDPADKFGTLCDPSDVGNPMPDLAACPEIPLMISDPTGAGGSGPGPGPGGVVCVCELGAGAPSPRAAAFGAIAVALALARRRRRIGARRSRFSCGLERQRSIER